jgi:hypothetical protein
MIRVSCGTTILKAVFKPDIGITRFELKNNFSVFYWILCDWLHTVTKLNS